MKFVATSPRITMKKKKVHLTFSFISFKTEFNPLQLGTRQYTNNSQLLIMLSQQLLRLILVLVKDQKKFHSFTYYFFCYTTGSLILGDLNKREGGQKFGKNNPQWGNKKIKWAVKFSQKWNLTPFLLPIPSSMGEETILIFQKGDQF